MNKPITSVVAACVVDKRKILLHCKNESTRNPELVGKWEYPGGMIEYGESPEGALLREMKEETGLSIVVMNLLSARTNIYEDGNHYLVLFYLCRLSSTYKDIPYVEGCKWVNYHTLLSLDCLPGTKEVARQIGEL